MARLREPRADDGTTAGLLLGWTTLASAVNVSTETRRGGGDVDGTRATPLDLAAQAAAGVVLLSVLRDQPPGARAAATSATRGLVTTALTSSRPTVVRALAAGTTAALGRVWVGRRR